MIQHPTPFQISIPAVEVEARPDLFRLFTRAPNFLIDVEDEASQLVATYPRIRESVHEVMELAQALESVVAPHLHVNGRPIGDVTLFRRVVKCYQESLRHPSPAEHCGSRARGAGDVVECSEVECSVRCPFVCADCREHWGELAQSRAAHSREVSASRAEVEWCPHLAERERSTQ